MAHSNQSPKSRRRVKKTVALIETFIPLSQIGQNERRLQSRIGNRFDRSGRNLFPMILDCKPAFGTQVVHRALPVKTFWALMDIFDTIFGETQILAPRVMVLLHIFFICFIAIYVISLHTETKQKPCHLIVRAVRLKDSVDPRCHPHSVSERDAIPLLMPPTTVVAGD